MKTPLLERLAQRRSGAQQRGLADDLLERARAHPRRKRRTCRHLTARLLEETLGHVSKYGASGGPHRWATGGAS